MFYMFQQLLQRHQKHPGDFCTKGNQIVGPSVELPSTWGSVENLIYNSESLTSKECLGQELWLVMVNLWNRNVAYKTDDNIDPCICGSGKRHHPWFPDQQCFLYGYSRFIKHGPWKCLTKSSPSGTHEFLLNLSILSRFHSHVLIYWSCLCFHLFFLLFCCYVMLGLALW